MLIYCKQPRRAEVRDCVRPWRTRD